MAMEDENNQNAEGASVFYHYTSLDTFLKIIRPEKEERPELRMYPANQMNDPLEGKFLANYLIAILSKIDSNVSGQIGEKISHMLVDNVNHSPSLLLSLSFIDGIDSGIGLWREYGAFGEGIALGVDVKEIIENDYLSYNSIQYGVPESQSLEILVKHIIDVFVHCALHKTQTGQYVGLINRKTLEELRIEILESKIFTDTFPIESLQFLFPKKEKHDPDEYFSSFTNLFLALNILTKHQAYHEEQEIRVINFPCGVIPKGVQVDEWGRMYYPIKLSPKMLKKITIGPNCRLSRMEIHHLAAPYFPPLTLEDIAISQVPIRRKNV